MSVEGKASPTSLLKVLKGKIRSLSPYSVDKTLSVDGACADAKTTGDELARRVKVSDIVDNMNTNDPNKVLSARQGYLLNDFVQHARNEFDNLADGINNAVRYSIDADNEAKKAMSAANDAKTAAEQALDAVTGGETVADKLKNAIQSTGGKMTGALEVIHPTEAYHAVTKEYVDNLRQIVRATLYASQWLESSAPYTQTIDVPGVTTAIDSAPHICLVLSNNPDTAYDEMEAFGCVSKGDTENEKIRFTCFEEKPAVDITLQIEVHK